MLIPVQTEGSRLTLILMHGMFGVLPWRRGKGLSQHLGADQPVYGIEAPGFDGSRKPRAKVPDAANEYAAELRRACLRGPNVILGVCGGCIMALQLAQQLAVAAQFSGEKPPVPLLMLVDPPGLPGQELSEAALNADVASMLQERVRDWFLGARERLEEIPFDIDDPKQLEIAINVGAAVEWSISTYYPTPYAGRVDVLAIEPIAQMVDRPHWPWRRVLIGQSSIRSLACHHHEIFTTHAKDVFHWVQTRIAELYTTATPDTGPVG